MSGSNRDYGTKALGLSAIAIALTISILLPVTAYHIGSTSASYHSEQSGYSQNETAATEKAIAQCALKPDPSLEECIAEQIKAGRDDYRSEQDLYAQRSMAQWAWWLLVVSLAQIPLGVLGLIALIVTIRQGREANEISRDSARHQNRAYMAVSSIEVDEPNWIDIKGQKRTKRVLSSKANLVLTNNGETPAHITFMYFSFNWLEGHMVSPMMDVSQEMDFFVHRGAPANVPIPIRADVEGLKEVGELFVIGAMNYKDVFGEIHTTEFCFQFGDSCSFYQLDFPIQMRVNSTEEYFKRIEKLDGKEPEKEN